MQDVIKRIYDYTLEEIMGERFGRYAKSIIQDRALPDVRDGLKPVQRRILYGMYKERHTFDKPYVKSARCVGDIMGKYHPHGDSSIYDAMVRMSQWWKQNAMLIDMQGNNGSMDGDGPAAMRYTEARLSKISNELLKDIDKETIAWAPNFDDTLFEPTVLPAKFPNLLVNGSTGISAGYATNIPPHNLGEIIDATIKRIDSPNCHLDTILDIVKGPDFPTGGIVEGKNSIIEAFTTGRGKVVVKAKYQFEKNKTKEQIIITEIPFEVNKALLVKKIDEIRIDKKIEGITEVRDESDREDSVRIAIDLKKDANKELIINYLLKNTDLQISYSYNMVAIVDRRPMTLGILPILDAYIKHQEEVITKRTKFDLLTAQKRCNIVDGLIKAISILDDVIKTIRASKNKSDAHINLVNEYKFTDEQAKAILDLQLYRLTNMDITELVEEQKKLKLIISGLEAILADEAKLKNLMKEELRTVKKNYAVPRKTEVRDEVTEIKIDTTHLIPKDDVMVTVTKEGYVKRTSMRSYNKDEDSLVKEGDYIVGIFNMNTMDTLLVFTDLGNYLYIPVYELPDLKWKELGKHVSNIIKISAEENIIAAYPVYNFDEENYITIFTKNGMVKRSSLTDFKVQRYSKPIVAIKLKDNDKVVSVSDKNLDNVFIATLNGYGLCYKTDEIPVSGLKTSGVKAINLKNDCVVSANLFNEVDYLTVITSKNTAKRIRMSDFDITTRARRGVQIVREVKTNPYYILKAFAINTKTLIGLKTSNYIENKKITEFPIADRYATGSSISKENIIDVFEVVEIISKDNIANNEEIKQEEVSLVDVDKKIMTIDDFLDTIN